MFPYFVSLNVVPNIGEATIGAQDARVSAAIEIPASVNASFICFMSPPGLE
jgi:hypothetical protein